MFLLHFLGKSMTLVGSKRDHNSPVAFLLCQSQGTQIYLCKLDHHWFIGQSDYWTITDPVSIGSIRTYFNYFLSQYSTFHLSKLKGNVICKIAGILFMTLSYTCLPTPSSISWCYGNEVRIREPMATPTSVANQIKLCQILDLTFNGVDIRECPNHGDCRLQIAGFRYRFNRLSHVLVLVVSQIWKSILNGSNDTYPHSVSWR